MADLGIPTHNVTLSGAFGVSARNACARSIAVADKSMPTVDRPFEAKNVAS